MQFDTSLDNINGINSYDTPLNSINGHEIDPQSYIGKSVEWLDKVPDNILIIQRDANNARPMVMSSDVNLRRWVVTIRDGIIENIRVG